MQTLHCSDPTPVSTGANEMFAAVCWGSVYQRRRRDSPLIIAISVIAGAPFRAKLRILYN
jgi:hypothetical protein